MGVDLRVVEWLRRHGHDAVHLREERLHRAADEQVFAKALSEDRIVLTFAEIEDLLGFSLPDLARLQFAWWDGGDFAAVPSNQSLAWMLAGRTATVNLSAQSVVFERDVDP